MLSSPLFLSISRQIAPLKRAIPFRVVIFAAFLVVSPFAHAVILMSNGDPSANTTAPTGNLAGSGWQYEGTFGSFLGTVLDRHHFITVKHIGIQSNVFVYQGVNYTVTGWFDDPMSDLRIFRVAGQMPGFAPLYSRSDEVGQNFVVIGRGARRGDPITVQGSLLGWAWGVSDGVQRWGQNQVSSASGNTLRATFDQGGTPNEAHLSGGDSGGAIFINDNGTWKLAGINSSVDGPYQSTPGGGDFLATLFDTRGLYHYGPVISGATPVPSGFYALRISNRLAWIRGIMAPALTEFTARAVISSGGGDAVSTTFLVNGDPSESKQVLVRGLGPSLQENGRPLPGQLANPMIDLYDSTGARIASNDNWKTGSKPVITAIKNTGLAPTKAKEAAILATLSPGTYTAVMRGAKNSRGIGLIDVRDLNDGQGSTLENICERGNVGTSASVLNASVTVQNGNKRLLLRAIGPGLHKQGVVATLDDPVLELYDSSGVLVASNDNWRSAPNSGEIWNTGRAPGDDREPALLLVPAPGTYTVVVRGSNGGTGACQVEAYLFP